MAVLKAQNLAKTYSKRKVVTDVSLQVESGQIVGLLGPNGAGKTTSFYMIVGLVARDEGTISIDDNVRTVTMPCKRLVNRVVDNLVHHVVKT